MKNFWLLGVSLLCVTITYGQDNFYSENKIKIRERVIIDNDFGGDPDGLFQLAHHLLSPTVEIRGIIGSQHYKEFYGHPGNVEYSYLQAENLLNLMNMSNKVPLYKGGNESLKDLETPVESDGAKAIIKEAMRDDVKTPLYVVCGAGLTNIASAYLMEPRIADRIILIWIGGPEYEQLTNVSVQKQREYNLGIDLKAAQVIFNKSNINIWQIPRDSYRQALYSYAELTYRMKTTGILGKYLMDKLDDLFQRANWTLGEAYVLGDSPLVLMTALQSSWERDTASCEYAIINAPKINDDGFYEENPNGRLIRIFTDIDTRLMFEDMIAKFSLYTKN